MSDDLEDDGSDMPTAPFWLTTYSDMVTLLMTFFVLIVSMSEVKVQKFEEALSYFTGKTGVLQHDAAVRSPLMQPIKNLKTVEQSKRYEQLIKYLQDNNLQDKVQVNLTEKGLHVIITDSVMFNSGAAELIDPSRTILQMVASVLGNEVKSVLVEGHTDDRPISTSSFPSNWELSGARASSVVRFLLAQGSALAPSAYQAVGYGEYHPIDANDTLKGRARNRRVEIMFSWESWQNASNPYKTPEPIPRAGQ